MTERISLRQRDAKFTFARKRYEIREILKDQPNALAHLELSQASASVSFREDECSWGLLGRKKAGILRFRVGRNETRDCKLRDLTIKLSLDQISHASEQPTNVYLLQRPAPAYMSGGTKSRTEETNLNLNPNIPTPIGSLAVGSYGKKWSSEEREVWTYTSQWEPVGQTYKTAVWRWLAKDSDLQLENAGDLPGAVVIGGHEEQPFYINCILEGKLVSNFTGGWSKRRWFIFKSPDNDPLTFYRIVPSGSQNDLQQNVNELEATLQTLMQSSQAISL